MSIKVGVRVRPFNQRESQLNCRLCVDMQKQTTRLLSLDDPSKNRDFAFDYSFWSHDGFDVEQSGYFRPNSDKYADQELVYNAVGKEILDNAWLGYHCCLFAYGQTGSGKSYSMIGYGANKGIVPIACQEIFKRIEEGKSQSKQFEVNVSMLEIYNQKVQDLLIPVNKRSKQGLKIREHKTYGVFVQGLTKHYVDTYEGIQAWMQQGNTHRSVAATQMNANSSRAHTIISIEFKQKETMHDQKVQRLSVIYLVDLAGSERIQKTGAAGAVLVQATNINKSLTVLGRVIENLADKAIGKGKGNVPPYRQSALTRILQNALGGNSKTLMICAISPATDNYDQTLSTLKYADQAKKIQNKAIVNQNQTDKMIRQLSEQNDKLKKLMEQFSKIGINLMDEDAMKKFNQMKEDMSTNAQMMKDAMNPKASKQEQTYQSKIDISKPHLVNLNEDILLSRKIKYSTNDKEETTIGRKNAEPPNDVIVGGIGIEKHHAVIIRKQEQGKVDFYLSPLNTVQPNCYINGELITKETILFHEDRLIFGTASTFLIIIPGQQRRIGPQIPKDIDYEFAQQELNNFRKQQIQKQEQQQKQKQLKQKQQQQRKLLQKELQLEKMKQQLQIQSQKSKQQMQARTVAEKQKYQQQLEKMKQQIELEKKKLEQASKKLKQAVPSEQKNVLETRISRYIPKTIEMNLIAKQFNRNIHTELKLSLLPETIETDALSNNEKFVRIIKIHVENRQLGYIYNWDIQKFNDRYQQVKYLWEKYLQTNQFPKLSPEEDPFYDPPIELQIGSGFLTTLSLPHLLDNQTELALVHDNGQCGTIMVNLIPTDETGEINLSNELEQTEQDVGPQNLIGKPLYFKIVIERAKIPENYSNIYVQYDITLNPNHKQTFKTKTIKQRVGNPVFNYSKTHKIESVTKQMIDVMLDSHICFKVFGQQFTNVQPSPTKKNETKITTPKKTVPVPATSHLHVPSPSTASPSKVTKPTAPVPTNNHNASADIKKRVIQMNKAGEKKKDQKCLLF